MTYGMDGWNKTNKRTETRASDCISRAEAIDFFIAEGMITAAVYVERMPPARPEQRKGTWRDWDGNLKTSGYCGICSACGNDSEYLTDYCPNCGADMRGTWEVEHDGKKM